MNNGRFIKGQHPSVKTEFKKGQHASPKTEFKKGCKQIFTGKRPVGKKAYHYVDGRSKNKEWVSWRKNKRNRLKRGAKGSYTFGEWEVLKKQHGFMCPCCKKSEPEIKLAQDHIIPLSKGGSDYIENIQPLCMHCNAVKHTKIIKY